MYGKTSNQRYAKAPKHVGLKGKLQPCKFCGVTGVNPGNMKKCPDCKGDKFTEIPQIIVPDEVKHVRAFDSQGLHENPLFDQLTKDATEKAKQILKDVGVENYEDIWENALDLSMHNDVPTTVGAVVTKLNSYIHKAIREKDD